MACEFLWNDIQEVSLYSPVLFRSSIPCTRGLVIHEDETGNFILRGVNTGNCCNQWTQAAGVTAWAGFPATGLPTNFVS